jgi:hypothetical protein
MMMFQNRPPGFAFSIHELCCPVLCGKARIDVRFVLAIFRAANVEDIVRTVVREGGGGVATKRYRDSQKQNRNV